MNRIVGGIDEVGYGAWAGPLVIAGVLLPEMWSSSLCRDSKSINHQQRQKALSQLEGVATIIVMSAEATVVDSFGVTSVLNELNTRMIYELFRHGAAHVTLDGVAPAGANFMSGNVSYIPKADSSIQVVSAASIVAKEFRDDEMSTYDSIFPGYDFCNNKGYHSKNHVAGLKELGPCALHRFSYQPIATYVLPCMPVCQFRPKKSEMVVWMS